MNLIFNGTSWSFTGEWNEEIDKKIREERIESLAIKQGYLPEITNLDFLTRYPWIRSLLVANFLVTNVRGMEGLSELEYLYLDASPNHPVDLSRLQKLKKLELNWSDGCESIESLGNILELTLVEGRIDDLSLFSKYTKTKFFSIRQPKRLRSINGIENFKNLESFEIVDSRTLTSIEPLNAHPKIRNLTIHASSKIEDLEIVTTLPSLRVLVLDSVGKIPTAKFLENCSSLEELTLLGSTNILDGDLSFLSNISKLKYALFENRKHYSHKRMDFEFNRKHYEKREKYSSTEEYQKMKDSIIQALIPKKT